MYFLLKLKSACTLFLSFLPLQLYVKAIKIGNRSSTTWHLQFSFVIISYPNSFLLKESQGSFVSSARGVQEGKGILVKHTARLNLPST